MPSREEIIAYINQVATENGVDPKILQQILQGESGLNPEALGDYNAKGEPESVGIAQYFKRGLGPELTAATGKAPGEDWKNDIDFMVKHAISTKGPTGGWNPWHAAANQGIGQYQGLPGQQPSTPGRRDRGSEVARSSTPMFPTLTNAAQGQDSGLLAELMRRAQPQKTLGGLAASALGLTDQNDPNRATTLGSLAGRALTGTAKRQAKLADVDINPSAPTSDAEQWQQKLKRKKTVGSSLASLFTGQPQPGAPAAPTTAGGSLFKFLGFG